MYKLKNTYIDRMISNKLTSNEIDFILHIAMYQDETGRVISVYYKDICAAISVSNQGFYNILNYLYMQRFTNGKHMLVQNFYEEFSRIFSIGKKCLQTWLTELKKKFLLFTSVKRNKANNYEMMMKNSTVLHLKKKNVPHEKHTFLKNIEELIERNFPAKMPGDKREKAKILRDIAKLAEAERVKKYINFPTIILKAVENSFIRQKEEGKKEPKLNAALVNVCLGEVLQTAYKEQI